MVRVTFKERRVQTGSGSSRVTDIIKNIRESKHKCWATWQGDVTTDVQSESQNEYFVDTRDLEVN